MRLYYIAEAEGRRRHVRSALGVNTERWNDFFRKVRDWRLRLRARYGIATTFELHALQTLAPRQSPGDLGLGRVSAEVEGRPDTERVILAEVRVPWDARSHVRRLDRLVMGDVPLAGAAATVPGHVLLGVPGSMFRHRVFVPDTHPAEGLGGMSTAPSEASAV